MGGMSEVSYEEFLERRKSKLPQFGKDAGDLGDHLFGFQKEIVRFACSVGRPAVWADTGLGKTRMMLTWCDVMGDTTLIVAPLAVADQTVNEASSIGMSARYVRDGADVAGPGIYVTNYEMIEKFDPAIFDAVALDEASILKNSDGKTRTRLINQFRDVQYRSAWTATPAPNDPEELTSQAEFLGHSTRTNMLAAYFVHDQDGWRLKGHAVDPMLDWMSQWAIAVRLPSDLGFSDDGYILPGLEVVPELVDVEIAPADDELFSLTIGGVSGRSRVRRETLEARVDRAVHLVFDSFKLANSDKLATWDGSQNMQRIDVENTPMIQQSANADSNSQSETLSTCVSTTSATRANGSERQSSALRSTGADANGTRKTQSIGQSRSNQPSLAIHPENEICTCSEPTASPLSSTMTCSNCKTTDAQFAERQSETGQEGGTTSITATRPEKSEEYSALTATLESESLETIRSFLETQSSTFLKTLEPWVMWCGLNQEQDELKARFGGLCFSIDGSMSPEVKSDLLRRWLDGERPILITKPAMHAMGINMQHCARIAFVGIGDSYEQYYQAIRRCYRFGQKRVVRAHIVVSELEETIAANVARKEKQANRIVDGMVRRIRRSAA